MLRDALWLSQVFRDIDSKMWCYLVLLCIYLWAVSLPFFVLVKKCSFVAPAYFQIGCSCSPLFALSLFSCRNNFPFVNPPLKKPPYF